MRKFLIYSILSISLLACKKNDEKVAETEAKDSLTDNSLSLDTSSSDGKLISLKELSPEKISEVLKSNHSDTLYVTNFFATWCGPCMQEIPHFRKKMDELAGKPVKFTFVSLDNKTDWATKVSDFADEYDIRKNVILLDGMLLKQEFFAQNFQSWSGEAIPFTLIRKLTKINRLSHFLFFFFVVAIIFCILHYITPSHSNYRMRMVMAVMMMMIKLASVHFEFHEKFCVVLTNDSYYYHILQ